MTKERDDLAGVIGHQEAADYLRAVRQVAIHTLRTELHKNPVLSTSKAVASYLQAVMGSFAEEQLRVLYLDGQNRLLREEVVATGSTRQVPISPRDIFRLALSVGATALILVHNHPSGTAEPSGQDIEATRRVILVAQELEITVHDHLIVTRSSVTSLKARGLI